MRKVKQKGKDGAKTTGLHCFFVAPERLEALLQVFPLAVALARVAISIKRLELHGWTCTTTQRKKPEEGSPEKEHEGGELRNVEKKLTRAEIHLVQEIHATISLLLDFSRLVEGKRHLAAPFATLKLFQKLENGDCNGVNR